MTHAALYWLGRIRQATTEDAVLAVVGEFLASLPHDGIAKLPESSRPDGVASRDDVIAHNVQVARDELLCKGPADVRELLREMAIVLGEASARLNSLSLGPPSGL